MLTGGAIGYKKNPENKCIRLHRGKMILFFRSILEQLHTPQTEDTTVFNLPHAHLILITLLLLTG